MDAATYSETIEDPAVSNAKMEGGYVTSRPKFTRRPRRMFAFQFVDMTDTDKATLLNFYNSMFGSSNAFTWTHPATSESINVRFDPSTKLKFSRIGFGPINVWQTDTIILAEV